MNTHISEKIELVLKHSQPGIRNELARFIGACGFIDPADPVLNSLVVQALIVAQPVRLADSGGAAVATEAGLARLGDRMESIAWSLARAKLTTIGVACLLSALIGAGVVLLAFKMWPEGLAGAFQLPRAEDPRIAMLVSVGADLHVDQKKGTVYVYLTGEVQPKSGQTRDGLHYLIVQP